MGFLGRMRLKAWPAPMFSGVPSVLVSGFPSFSFPGQRGGSSRGEECYSTPGLGRVLYCQEGQRRGSWPQLCFNPAVTLGEPFLISAQDYVPPVQRRAGCVSSWTRGGQAFSVRSRLQIFFGFAGHATTQLCLCGEKAAVHSM